MAKAYVLTNRRKLDEFLTRLGKLEDLGMIIGQVSGKPKYPPGHVGKRSREKDRTPTRRISEEELYRRRWVRFASKQLEGMTGEQRKRTRKQWVDWFRSEGLRPRGIARKKRQAVAVARVAGVIASDRSTGQYHQKVLGKGKLVKIPEQSVRDAMFRFRITMTEALLRFGKQKKAELRQAFMATGHSDTGRVYRNIQYMIWDIGGKKKAQAFDKEMRALARAKRKARAFIRKRKL